LIVRDIDFQSRRVTVEVPEPTRSAWLGRLDDFVAACRNVVFVGVVVRVPPGFGKENLGALKTLESEAVTVIETPQSAPPQLDEKQPRSAEHRCVVSAIPAPGGGLRPRYLLTVTDVPSGLSMVSDFAMVCGMAAALNSRALTRLHLTLYELAANTIEHAVFESRCPALEVEMSFGEAAVEVRFRDNALAFSTAEHGVVDIEKKIKAQERRGLGLYLLGEVAEGLSFERKDGWNCTSFRVNLSEPRKQRRKKMVEFSLEIVPVAFEGVIVLKPKGHIDSESAIILEKHFDFATEAGKTRVVLDLSEADFISSSGIGLLLGSRGMLRQRGGDLLLLRPSQPILTVLEIAGVDDYFRILKSFEEIASISMA